MSTNFKEPDMPSNITFGNPVAFQSIDGKILVAKAILQDDKPVSIAFEIHGDNKYLSGIILPLNKINSLGEFCLSF